MANRSEPAEALIFDAVRTPRGRGRPGGALHVVAPVQLAACVLEALQRRVGFGPAEIEDIALGCVESVGDQGGNIARAAVFAAGFDETVPGVQVNRFCGSGLEAVSIAAAKIMSGQIDLAIGGGVESMSLLPIFSEGGAYGADPRINDLAHFVPQGVSADLIATRHGYSRADVDAYAAESQHRAARAVDERRFARSLVPVSDDTGTVLLDCDELIRAETTPELLGTLKPSFEYLGDKLGFDAVAVQRYPELTSIEHVHTAGNSSGLADGAAAVLVGSRTCADRFDSRPRARIRSFSTVGSEPCIMLTAPAEASRRALARAGMDARDIDLIECNEAFAAVVLRFISDLGVDPACVNVNGGAIALGHPLGATGAMLVGTALDELERQGLETALVTLCVGAGMGVAMVIERV